MKTTVLTAAALMERLQADFIRVELSSPECSGAIEINLGNKGETLTGTFGRAFYRHQIEAGVISPTLSYETCPAQRFSALMQFLSAYQGYRTQVGRRQETARVTTHLELELATA